VISVPRPGLTLLRTGCKRVQTGCKHGLFATFFIIAYCDNEFAIATAVGSVLLFADSLFADSIEVLEDTSLTF